MKSSSFPQPSASQLARLPPWPRIVVGAACLDFVNTIDPRVGDNSRDHVTDYRTLLSWSVHAGALRSATRARLEKEAARDERQAADVFARAIAFREALYQAAAAQAAGRPVPAQSIDRILAAIRHAWQHARLGRFDRRYAVQPLADLDMPLSTLAFGAEQLFTSDRWTTIRMCEAHGCGWVFFDSRKGPHRRWCSMAVCGNREKVRRHARRQRRASADSKSH